MANGLVISLDDFQSLNTKDKLDVLYKNQVTTIELIKGYKFNSRIQYVWLGMLTIVAGFGKYLNII